MQVQCTPNFTSFQYCQSLYSTVFCKMFVLRFLIALMSTVRASPMAGEFTGLADLSSGFSVDGFSPSTEGFEEIAHQFMNSNDEALTWQDPPRNLISTPAISENSIAYSTKFVIAGAGHKVEKAVQKPVGQGERFKNFDCGNLNGVCCMGNPLIHNRAAQRCEQSIQPCSIPFHNARLMLYTEGDISDAGNEFLWPMDSRIAHYCYEPEYLDDCSKLLDEEVRTFILDRKSRM